MSLINDMLKDLEKRRARGLDEPAGPLSNLTLGGGTASSKKHIGIYIGVVITAVALLIAAGYLAWKRLSPQLLAGVSTVRVVHQVTLQPPATPHPPTTGHVVPVSPASAAAKSTSVPRHRTVKPRVAASKTVVRRAHLHRPAHHRTHSDQPKVRPEAPATGSDNVQKRQRPLTNAQRSAIAYQRGYALLARHHRSQGEEQLRRALKLDVHNLAARELLAGMYMRTGRLVEAGSLLKEGVRVAPNHTVFAELYARVLSEQHEPAAAVRVLEQHVGAAHGDINYLAMLGALYQQVGRQREAAQVYRQLVQARPDHGDWWAGLGISLEALGQSAAARQAYQRAQSTGNLTPQLQKYTAERLSALKSSATHAD